MWITIERICKKMLHTKLEEKQPGGIPRTRWINQIGKYIDMRRKKVKKYKKIGSGKIEMAGDP